MKAVFDTNILIDYLNGEEKARREINRYDAKLISTITHIEILVGATDDEHTVRAFLSIFDLKCLTKEVAEEAIKVRKSHRMKIPDAIIYATARTENCLIVSRNINDFKPDWVDVRVPYQL